MISESLPRLAVVVLFGLLCASTGCSSSPPGCPVCGTDKNGTVGLIDVMAVPGHSASGAPGGPFNLFDISWMDPANHIYYIADTVGIDVAAFNTSITSPSARLAGTVPSSNPDLMPVRVFRIRRGIKSFLP